MIDQYEHFEPQYEQDEAKCPKCNGNIVTYYQSNGPADYDKISECLGCGETWG